MINRINYFETIKDINFASLPEALQKGHDLVLKATKNGSDWTMYSTSDTIKKTVDLYLEKLSSAVSDTTKKSRSASKSIANYKAKRSKLKKKVAIAKPKAKKPTSAAKPKAKAKAAGAGAGGKKPAKPKKEVVLKVSGNAHHLTEEIKLIKRFANMVGKVRTKTQVLAYVRALQKAIRERKVRKTTVNGIVIKGIQDRAVKLYNLMLDKKLNEAKIDLKDGGFKDDLLKISNADKVYLSIGFLKRFINMQGLAPEIAKAESLLKSIRNAIKANKFEKDPYSKEISQIEHVLSSYLDGKIKDVDLTQAALSGLMGLPQLADIAPPKKAVGAKAKKKSPEAPIQMTLPAALSGLFTPVDKPGKREVTHKVFSLRGELGQFLGLIERLEYALLLRGEKGAGKTRFLYQLMDAFAEEGYQVANFTLEISKDSDLVKRMMEKYLKPKNRPNIHTADEAPNGIETIREAAKYFDVVAIDSYGKLGVKQSEFDRLRKDFPNTFFLVVFQSTTAGTARGGSGAEFDAGAVCQIDHPGIAWFEKNRYAMDDAFDLQYDVNNQCIYVKPVKIKETEEKELVN